MPQFDLMTIAEIVEWVESRAGVVTPEEIQRLREDVRSGVRTLARRLERNRARQAAEEVRLSQLWDMERQLKGQGYHLIAGVDEAGRGPLAGPVVAAAVLFPDEIHIPRVNDSKQLSPAVRDELFELISASAAAIGVGIVDHAYIDQHNILNATRQAMRQAVRNLGVVPDLVLVDGNMLPSWPFAGKAVLQGDAHSFSIAAASIIAKVTRDRLMLRYDRLYPEYGFARHKGYSCQEHFQAITTHGPCPIHRLSFLSRFRGEEEDA